MKTNLLKSLLISVALFLFLLASPANADAAAKIYFDPSTYTTSQGSDLTVKVQIDVETTPTFGADATIIFNPSELTLKSIENGGFFSDFSKANGQDSIEIHGSFLNSAFQTKTGSGTFATLVFTPVKNSGSGAVSFACEGNGNDTFILDANGANILTNCSTQTNQLNLNYGSSSQNPNSTPNDTNAGGPTNACGGTCGSHYNCNAGLFCSNGFCRNPDCPSSATCGCTAGGGTTATVRPRATVKPTPKPSVKPTPQAIVLKKYTPAPLVLPTEKPADEVANAPTVNLKAIAMWSGLALLALLIALMIKKYLKKHKGKNLPPDIPDSTPPMMPPPFLPPDMGPPTPPISNQS